MTGLKRALNYAAVGSVVAGGIAFAAERAAHDYQLARFQVSARGLGGRLMNPEASGATKRSSLRVLHLSDTHFYRGREDLVAWLRVLARRETADFDFVVLTGDMLATNFGDAQLAARALTPLVESGIPGAYVFGAHDYYANRLGNPLKYLLPQRRRDSGSCKCQKTADFGQYFRGFLADSPWLDLNNRRECVDVAGWRVELAGVDDPHIGCDDFPGFTPGEPALGQYGVLRIGLAHAPYARVLDAFAADGADLVFCGHTHGGQVCLPGGRALVTNSDLAPEFASGVFSWDSGRPLPGMPAGAMRVSLSPGLGTSPFTPWRVFCPPCAFLVELG